MFTPPFRTGGLGLGLVLSLAAGCQLSTPQATELALPPDSMLERVTQSSDSACFAESVEIEITPSSRAPIEVWVAGSPGPRHRIPMLGPVDSIQHIPILVRSGDGTEERLEIRVRMKECRSRGEVAIIASANPFHTNQVDFRILDPGNILANQTSFEWSFGDGAAGTTDGPFATHDYTEAIDHDAHYSMFDVALTLNDTVTATRPIYVESPYQNGLMQGFVRTEVDCDALAPDIGDPGDPDGGDPPDGGTVGGGGGGGGPFDIDLPIDLEQPSAPVVDVGRILSVRNPHHAEVVFDQFIKVTKSCNSEVEPSASEIDPLQVFGQPLADQLAIFGLPLDTSSFDENPLGEPGVTSVPKDATPLQQASVSVPARQTVTGEFRIGAEDIAPDTCVVGVHLIGDTRERDSKRAYGACYVRVRQSPERIHRIEDTETLAAIGAVMEDLGTDLLDSDALHELEELGTLTRTVQGWTGGTP